MADKKKGPRIEPNASRRMGRREAKRAAKEAERRASIGREENEKVYARYVDAGSERDKAIQKDLMRRYTSLAMSMTDFTKTGNEWIAQKDALAVRNADKYNKAWQMQLMLMTVQPLQQGISAYTICQTIGMYVGLAAANPEIRRTVQRGASGVFSALADAVDKMKGDHSAIASKFREMSDAYMKKSNFGHVPMTAESAAIQYISLVREANEKMRDPNYAGVDVMGQFNDARNTLEEICKRDQVDWADVRQQEHIIVGRMCRENPDMVFEFTQMAYDGVGPAKAHMVRDVIYDENGMPRTVEHAVWTGEFESPDDEFRTSFSEFDEDFKPRTPITGRQLAHQMSVARMTRDVDTERRTADHCMAMVKRDMSVVGKDVTNGAMACGAIFGNQGMQMQDHYRNMDPENNEDLVILKTGHAIALEVARYDCTLEQGESAIEDVIDKYDKVYARQFTEDKIASKSLSSGISRAVFMEARNEYPGYITEYKLKEIGHEKYGQWMIDKGIVFGPDAIEAVITSEPGGMLEALKEVKDQWMSDFVVCDEVAQKYGTSAQTIQRLVDAADSVDADGNINWGDVPESIGWSQRKCSEVLKNVDATRVNFDPNNISAESLERFELCFDKAATNAKISDERSFKKLPALISEYQKNMFLLKEVAYDTYGNFQQACGVKNSGMTRSEILSEIAQGERYACQEYISVLEDEHAGFATTAKAVDEALKTSFKDSVAKSCEAYKLYEEPVVAGSPAGDRRIAKEQLAARNRDDRCMSAEKRFDAMFDNIIQPEDEFDDTSIDY